MSDESLPSPETSDFNEPKHEAVGDRVGPYKLLQLLGEGGMGEVWVADQSEPVRRQVALKLIKLGMDSAHVLARFAAEKQALALMDHPNIAKVLDAGMTSGGRPYFVMELVKGIPITQFCDREKLAPRERLELFIPVCQAVQHAHQKGIIHRDLKPSNVLIALYDGKPVPKVIDFGVAKATGSRLTEQSMFTEVGSIVGTLEYMAPEQAELNNLDIDTRADIYSLGVILYELLTGSTPFSRKQLQNAAFDQMLRLIREVEPSKPSTKLSTSQELPTLAAARKLEPKRLARLVRGELDWIVMKCLEKERARRYETANGLAADLQRYLADEPVLASPPSARYRMRKFVRKYKGVVVAAGLIATVLLLGIATTSIGFWQANRNANIAAAATEKAEDEAARATAEAQKARIAQEKANEEAARATSEAHKARTAQEKAEFEAYAANLIAADASLMAHEPATVRARLDACPKRFRGWEWRYLNARSDQSLSVWPVNDDANYSAVFNPAGDRIVTRGKGSTARLLDVATGREIVAFRGHEGQIICAAFCPAGDRIVTASHDKTARIWDATSGKEIAVLRGHEASIDCAAFNPAGDRIVTNSMDGTVRTWDVASGKEITVVRLTGRSSNNDYVNRAAFNPAGDRVVTASVDHTARVWDATSGKEIAVLRGHTDRVNGVAFNPAGDRIVTASQDKTARVWDAATGKEIAVLHGHDDMVLKAVFNPAGDRIATSSWDKTARVWDAATGQELAVLRGHQATTTCAAFNPTGNRILTLSHDRTARIWDAASDKEIDILRGHQSQVLSAAFNPTGDRIVTASSDKTARIWDVASGKEITVLRGHQSQVLSAAFNPTGDRIVTASSDKTARLWDVASGKEITVLRGHEGEVYCAGFNPAGDRVVTASLDKTARIWDVASGKEITVLRGHEHRVQSAAFNPAGDRIVTASLDKTARIWDVASSKELAVLRGHTGVLKSAVFNPAGDQIVTAAYDKTARVWDAATGKELAILRGHQDSLFSAAFNPVGDRIVTASVDKTARIWDVATGKELAVLRGHEHVVEFAAFSPAGDRIVTASVDKTARIWHTLPYRDRFLAIAAARVAEKDMQARVAPRITAGENLDNIQQSLIADRSLDEVHRRAGLALVTAERERLATILAEKARNQREADSLIRSTWIVVAKPDSTLEATEKALDQARRASAAWPDDEGCSCTLGLALYRVGKFEEAISELKKADGQRAKSGGAPMPADWAFIAMAQFKLGKSDEAKASMARLRELMTSGPYAKDPEGQAFLREAEALMEKK